MQNATMASRPKAQTDGAIKRESTATKSPLFQMEQDGSRFVRKSQEAK